MCRVTRPNNIYKPLVRAGAVDKTDKTQDLVRCKNSASNVLCCSSVCLLSIPVESLLRKAGVAHVDRRLLRYYLIVRRLPNVFTLACRSLGSIYYDTGSPRDGKTPFGWLHPCRLVTDSRRYLIIGAPATMPLHSSFIFTLNNRASTIS